jgi:hypothetical protein
LILGHGNKDDPQILTVRCSSGTYHMRPEDITKSLVRFSAFIVHPIRSD